MNPFVNANPGHIHLLSISHELKSEASLLSAVLNLMEKRKFLLYRHMEVTYEYHPFEGEYKQRAQRDMDRINKIMLELQRDHGCIVRDEPGVCIDSSITRYYARWIIYWGECPWCHKSASEVKAQ